MKSIRGEGKKEGGGRLRGGVESGSTEGKKRGQYKYQNCPVVGVARLLKERLWGCVPRCVDTPLRVLYCI